MIIRDGICYADSNSDEIRVLSAKALDDMMMLIEFAGGELRLFDATVLKGEAFEPLRDADVFNDVIVDDGVVTWDDGRIDCAPEYMYKNSFKYENAISPIVA